MNDCSETRIIRFHAKSTRYSEFDNSAPYAIRLHGLTWPTVTHYLLTEQYPGQNINRVRHAISVEEATRVAPGEHALERNKWQAVRDDFLISALRAKFSQHLDLEQMLYQTGHEVLVYADTTDSYMGIGEKGYGQNMMGRLLMAVRRRMGRPALNASLSSQDLQDLIEQEGIARKHPDNADKLSDLACLYLKHGWYDRAISAARFSLTADPGHEWGYQVIAISLIKMRQHEKAIEPLKELIKLDPDESSYFRLLSDAYRELGREIPAILYDRRAEKLDGEEE